MRKLFLFLILSSFCFANVTIKDRLLKATPGDFIITEQGKSYSLLLVRSIEPPHLTLEEIIVDQSNIDLKKINWKNWIENRAPGADSWTAFALDIEKNTLVRSYSFLENQWLFIEKSDYFFGKLLSLSFQPTRDNERKKIGPAPMPGEIDRRKFWKPQLVREGKKHKKCEYEVLRAKWPSDKTQLAGCIFELYLDVQESTFPFPYWMEVQHPHYTFKIRAIDSGSGIQSPMKLLK
ncbi:MAG: hypothetical protein K1000chlam3_00203 [Chlamydiae bacterium]|nr:hypothetical protein [Chlamydiota bacterium]